MSRQVSVYSDAASVTIEYAISGRPSVLQLPVIARDAAACIHHWLPIDTVRPCRLSVYFTLDSPDQYIGYFSGHTMTSLLSPSNLQNRRLTAAEQIGVVLGDLSRDRLSLQMQYQDNGVEWYELSRVKLVFFRTVFQVTEAIGDRDRAIRMDLLWTSPDAPLGMCVPAVILHDLEHVPGNPLASMSVQQVCEFIRADAISDIGARDVRYRRNEILRQGFTLGDMPLIESVFQRIGFPIDLRVFDRRLQMNKGRHVIDDVDDDDDDGDVAISTTRMVSRGWQSTGRSH